MDGGPALVTQLIAALMSALPKLIEAATTGLAQLSTLWATADWSSMTATIQRSDLNFVTRTPPRLSYNLGGVMDLYNEWQPVFLGGGALACVCGAAAAMGRVYFGWSWSLGENAARLIIGLALGLNAPRMYQIVIDASNRVCDAIVTSPFPLEPPTVPVDPVTAAIIFVIWVILGFRLLVRMGYRIVYFDLLLAVGPVALAGLFIPGGETYARFWLKAFFGLLIGQVLVTVCFRLSGALNGEMAGNFAGLAMGIGVLLLAYDLATMFADIKGGGLGGVLRGAGKAIGI